MDPACRIDDPEAVEYTYGRQARSPFNVTGSPALSVPTGFSTSGLPLGMQIVGKPFTEALVYRVAHAYEQATQWVERKIRRSPERHTRCFRRGQTIALGGGPLRTDHVPCVQRK